MLPRPPLISGWRAVPLSTGAMWSGVALGAFCTPTPAAVAAPVAEAEFSPADASHIAVLDQIDGSGDPLSFPQNSGILDIPSADDAIYWDVSNDGFLSPLDALLVINELHRLVPSQDDVQVQVETLFGYTFVVVHAPLPIGVSISDYGEIGQQDAPFFVNVTAQRPSEDHWSHGVPRTSWTYLYGLGELEPGDYVFHLSINGWLRRSETFSIADTQRPQASLSVSDVTAPTQWHQFTVTYTDDHAVQLTSLDDDDIVVTGPNGYREKAMLVSIDANTDNRVCTVTYQIPAPAASHDGSGNWNWLDNGEYEVWLEGDQVWDTSQNAAEAAHLGTFWVDVLQWTPYVPSGADVRIVSGIRSTNARVELTFADTGYRVADWGRVVRQGNSFVVAANVERDVTGIHVQMLTHDSHTYRLGALEPGDYSFRFLVHGQLVQHVRFTQVDNPWSRTLQRNLIPMLPFGPALRCELPARPFVESVWIADDNADAGPLPALPAPANSGQGLLEMLAQDVAQDVAKQRDSGEPLPEDALFRLWDELWNLPL
ncbi:MAG: hypothetical protein EA424_25245 [Planctomycetaceae bacterium]|nr:MAG: hypothetical protein EA424_25245 [Planctomycetaceae bacterium]